MFALTESNNARAVQRLEDEEWLNYKADVFGRLRAELCTDWELRHSKKETGALYNLPQSFSHPPHTQPSTALPDTSVTPSDIKS